ncbi:hypothetical protein KGM_201729 [Danaus plexippus plexippus]|uniref:Uncharacterized protein n=1 Tax=Danaus plexippus plexippus TaxID=278856 RepID=A0A212EVM9_DANPL|nr:hypothetical protein KGM_201729 [Danaus plexippus plexippus]
MYFADPQPSKSELLHTEKHLAVLLLYLVGLSWYLFITHLFLLYACCMKNVKVLNVYIVLIITHLCVTIVFCVYNLFLCLIFDNQCYDHKSGSNDIAASLGVALAGVVYCVVWLVLIFAVCNYKLTLKYLVFYLESKQFCFELLRSSYLVSK